MLNLVNYRLKVTLNDGRQLIGQMLAFDKHMNMVLAECEEFRRVKGKKSKTSTDPKESAPEVEQKRTLGLVILRGETIVSVSVDGPPPNKEDGPGMMAGPGKGVAAGRGMPLMPPAGGISARPMPYARPPAGFPPGMMPPGFPGAPAGMPPGFPPQGMPPGFRPGMPPVGFPPQGMPPGFPMRPPQ
ncbi:hypothetical protein FFLO_02785 [Filobasidium floriforme]|uniref:Sm protein B n=1 Tax=Filobasidium floriforme TaxID=5210 RepID=A0A8K0NQY6_9TREE|nr:uncharacterized protein HD553DRAFT_306970 [Filobasidium floriforme]KAG7558315.1 hypothetical protein FFLO_02785 [Filobasidium floriforme]KAH8087962.1 hypothetical protein HD553DRAFT_306970 [Filobasidium floriforme]